MKEIWKPVNLTNFSTRYEVSNFGRLRTVRRKILSPRMRPCRNLPYLKVNLAYGEKRKLCSVARLVALTFIPNPKHKAQVNHLDKDRLNNSVKNLEWTTPKENINHKLKKIILCSN